MVDGNFNGASAAWGDYDNDGDLDLFVATHYHPPVDFGRPNLLYRNDGNGTSPASLPFRRMTRSTKVELHLEARGRL
jgi:hypothetical protein